MFFGTLAKRISSSQGSVPNSYEASDSDPLRRSRHTLVKHRSVKELIDFYNQKSEASTVVCTPTTSREPARTTTGIVKTLAQVFSRRANTTPKPPKIRAPPRRRVQLKEEKKDGGDAARHAVPPAYRRGGGQVSSQGTGSEYVSTFQHTFVNQLSPKQPKPPSPQKSPQFPKWEQQYTQHHTQQEGEVSVMDQEVSGLIAPPIKDRKASPSLSTSSVEVPPYTPSTQVRISSGSSALASLGSLFSAPGRHTEPQSRIRQDNNWLRERGDSRLSTVDSVVISARNSILRKQQRVTSRETSPNLLPQANDTGFLAIEKGNKMPAKRSPIPSNFRADLVAPAPLRIFKNHKQDLAPPTPPANNLHSLPSLSTTFQAPPALRYKASVDSPAGNTLEPDSSDPARATHSPEMHLRKHNHDELVMGTQQLHPVGTRPSPKPPIILAPTIHSKKAPPKMSFLARATHTLTKKPFEKDLSSGFSNTVPRMRIRKDGDWMTQRGKLNDGVKARGNIPPYNHTYDGCSVSQVSWSTITPHQYDDTSSSDYQPLTPPSGQFREYILDAPNTAGHFLSFAPLLHQPPSERSTTSTHPYASLKSSLNYENTYTPPHSPSLPHALSPSQKNVSRDSLRYASQNWHTSEALLEASRLMELGMGFEEIERNRTAEGLVVGYESDYQNENVETGATRESPACLGRGDMESVKTPDSAGIGMSGVGSGGEGRTRSVDARGLRRLWRSANVENR